MPVRRSERHKKNNKVAKVARKSSRMTMGLGAEVSSDHIVTKLNKKVFSSYENILHENSRITRSNANRYNLKIDSKDSKSNTKSIKRSKKMGKTEAVFQTCKVQQIDKPLSSEVVVSPISETSDCKLADSDGVYIFSPIYRLLEDKITEEELPLFSFEDNSKGMNFMCENITLTGC